MKILKALLEVLIISGVLCEGGSSHIPGYINRRHQKLIEGSIDMKADPCEDFYQYSCGKWPEYVSGAGDKFFETLSMLDYQVNRDLSRHMKRIRLRGSPRFVRKAYEYYKSCVDVEQYEPLEYLRWMKDHEQMKWPSLWRTKTTGVEFDWVYTLAVMRKYGMNGIFIEEIVLQKKDEPTKAVIDLDKPVEGGGFVSLSEENFKVIIFTLLVPIPKIALDKLWLEISEFEDLLTKLDDIEDENGSQLITVKDLPLQWQQQYLKIVLNRTTLDPDMELYIQNIPYMEALDALLQQYDHRFICKYLEIRFLWHMHVKGPENFMPEHCVSSTRSLLPLAMHWIYEQQRPEIIDESPKIHELFHNILQHFKRTLRSNHNNFNETVLDYLLRKLDSIQLKVGNLPRIDTVQVLESHYHNLTLNVSDFYGNHLKLMHLNHRALHASLESILTTNASEFFHLENYETASSSSPFFVQRTNIVIVPWTVLQRPVYHADLEDIYKYSSIGFLLAHEILHGFDYTGLEVDVDGKINSAQYDNIVANAKFDHNYKCLRELNPTVIDEKIADVSGLRYAYETFFTLHPDAVNKTRIVYGREMSLKKLFFLNFTQFFCGTSSSDEYINTSEHGIDSDRVNDAISHFPEFARAYGCSRQSRMHPNETCNLWRR